MTKQILTKRDVETITGKINERMKRCGDGRSLFIDESYSTFKIGLLWPDGTEEFVYRDVGADKTYTFLYGILNGLYLASMPANVLLD